MIICFTATGNTLRIAKILQSELGDDIVRFAPGQMRDPSKISLPVTDDRVIWMFPTHGWGVPKLLQTLIPKMEIETDRELVHHLVTTCGDDIGNADKMWRKYMRKRGWRAGSAFSVQMPNTYTMMPGFDVDTAEVAAAKIEAADAQAREIAESIRSGEVVTRVVRGKWAWFKSNVAYRWFMRYKTRTKPFWSDDNCTGCGRCSRNCPLRNIAMDSGRPKWGETCTMCSRCYHCCPAHAVQYGKATAGKGQYLCPGYKIS